MAAQRRYRGALRALAKERATINAAMAAAAAPGKDGLKKVCWLPSRHITLHFRAVAGMCRALQCMGTDSAGTVCRDDKHQAEVSGFGRLIGVSMAAQAHEAMWALKGSLAKEPRYTEAFLSACMRALMPLQTAKLIVAFFPRTVWPDFSTICASIALDAGDNTVLDGPV